MAVADSTYVDRTPPKSPAMQAAYAGLAEAERAVADAHAYGNETGDWQPHHEAISVMVDWHAEIGRIALKGGRA